MYSIPALSLMLLIALSQVDMSNNAKYLAIENYHDLKIKNKLNFWCGINEDGSAELIRYDKDELNSDIVITKDKWFYTKISSDGNTVENDKYIGTLKRINNIKNNSRNTLKLHDGSWLIVASNTLHDYESYMFILKNGALRLYNTIKDIRLNSGLCPSQLLKDSKGNVYAIDNSHSRVSGIFGIIKVFPEAEQKITSFKPALKIGKDISIDFSASILDDNKIIVFAKDQHFINMVDKKSRCHYFIADIKGNIIEEPKEIILEDCFFRKVKDYGLYGQANAYNINDENRIKIYGGIDFYDLNNGNIVLSITAYDYSSKSLCIYQLLFNDKGELIKSKSKVEYYPKNLEYGKVPQVKSSVMIDNIGKQGTKPYLTTWGFDEQNDFYLELLNLK